MKTHILIYGLLFAWLVTGCDNSVDEELCVDPAVPAENESKTGEEDVVPEGYFVVRFTPSAFSETRAAVTGSDSRVQHIRYVVYNGTTGAFVKEKVILNTASAVTWPLPMVKDTLPEGNYRAVFLGNVEDALFPYNDDSDVLSNYQTTYADARISLPPAEFTDNTEYYWANVTFSDANPNPSVLLQRIIGSVQLKRVLIDGEDALNMLLDNIVEQVNEGDLVQKAVDAVWPSLIESVLNQFLDPIIGDLTEEVNLANTLILTPAINTLTGVVDLVLNPLVDGLVAPIVNTLNELLLQELVSQLGFALTGNADKDNLIEYLGVLLNPWNNATAGRAVVTVDNFPKSIDFDLTPAEVYPAGTQLAYGFNTTDFTQERHISLKTFAGSYHISKIDIVGQGLVGGLVVDGVVDDFLLIGILVDVDDPLTITGSMANRRYESAYSFLGLGSQTSTDETEPLTLSLKLGNIANIDGILGGILDPLLGGVLGAVTGLVSALPVVGDILDTDDDSTTDLQDELSLAIKDLTITITLPLNLSLLQLNNLTVSGSWGPVEAI